MTMQWNKILIAQTASDIELARQIYLCHIPWTMLFLHWVEQILSLEILQMLLLDTLSCTMFMECCEYKVSGSLTTNSQNKFRILDFALWAKSMCLSLWGCGSVFDAIWPVSAVPKAQRGPKGAPKMKIFTFWLFWPPKWPRERLQSKHHRLVRPHPICLLKPAQLGVPKCTNF